MRPFLQFCRAVLPWVYLSICSMPCLGPKSFDFGLPKRSLFGTGVQMSDVLFLTVLFAFFAMAIGFVLGLERL